MSVSGPAASDTINWSSQTASLNDVLKDGVMPFLVRLNIANAQGPDVHADIRQPLLLYAKRAIRKVRAKCLAPDESSGKLSRIGSPLAIPEDYPGVFQLMSAECGAACYTNLEQVINDKTHVFVCSSELRCFKEDPNRTDGQYGTVRVPKWCPLYPGKLFLGEVKTQVPHKLLRTKSKTKMETVRYVECPDAEGMSLFLPINTPGQFYAWYEDDMPIGENPNMVYSASKLPQLPLPAVIRLVDGPVPPVASAYFTPLLQMEAVYSEATLIAGMVREGSSQGTRSLITEISADPGLQVTVPEDGSKAIENSAIKRARALCEQEAGRYMRTMKVVHRVVPSELGDGLARPEEWRTVWQKISSEAAQDPFYYSLRFARSKKSKFDDITGLFVEIADQSKWKAVEIPMHEPTSPHSDTPSGELRVEESVRTPNGSTSDPAEPSSPELIAGAELGLPSSPKSSTC